MEVAKKTAGTDPPTKRTHLATRYQTGEESFISIMWYSSGQCVVMHCSTLDDIMTCTTFMDGHK